MVHWSDLSHLQSGDPEVAANYRGITVVVILAKLYAMVSEARASGWAEQEKCRAKGQGRKEDLLIPGSQQG